MINKTILFAFLFCGFTVWGQEKIVDLKAKGNRTIERAYRLTENPKVIDTIVVTPATNYPLLVLQHKTSISLEPIQPATIKTEPKLSQLYHSYIKAGIGSTLMPLGEIYFSNARSRKYTYGVHLKHVSSFGEIKGYAPAQFDRNSGKLFGGINEKNYTLLGDIHYNNKGFHYYGIQDPSLNRDTIAQRFSDVGATFSYASHKADSAKINYKIGLMYNNFLSKKPIIDSLSKWRAQENFVALTSTLNYKLGKEVFSVDLNAAFNGYKYGLKDSSISVLDSGIVRNNTVISLKPSITTYAKENRFKAKIGLDLTMDADKKNSLYIYPIAELKYSLFNDLFIPYLGAKGGIKQNTFKSLTGQNEFMLTNVKMRNENTVADLFFGIKGTITKRISFNASANFAYVKDKALFVTDTTFSLRNKFNIIYDTMSITTIEGSISYQLVEKLKIEAIGRYFSYALNNNSYAWNLPQFQIIARGSYNLYDKFYANVDVNFEGGRKALVYKKEENTTVEDNQIAKTLGFVADADLSVEYRYNKRISAFLQFNNLAGQRYKRWYNTPVQGFQVMGGVTFRF